MTAKKINYHLIAEQSNIDNHGRPLREVAYQAIKDSIMLGIVETRVSLAEERLAKVLKISRTPVREALALLEHEGLLVAIPYKGLFVKEISVTEFLEMFDTVELIEPVLASRATSRATADDIKAMQNALSKAEKFIPDDPGRHFLACREFQHHIGNCAKHNYMARLLLNIEERADLYLINTWEVLPNDNMLAAIQDRHRILEAICEGDEEKAAQSARKHAQNVKARWHNLFKDD